jgi:hypothetical protein
MMPCFVGWDRPISGDQFSCLDRARAGPPAIWARPRLVGRLRLFRGELLAQLPGNLPSGLVGALLDRGEVEFGPRTRVPKHFLGKQGEELLKSGILGNILR